MKKVRDVMITTLPCKNSFVFWCMSPLIRTMAHQPREELAPPRENNFPDTKRTHQHGWDYLPTWTQSRTRTLSAPKSHKRSVTAKWACKIRIALFLWRFTRPCNLLALAQNCSEDSPLHRRGSTSSWSSTLYFNSNMYRKIRYDILLYSLRDN